MKIDKARFFLLTSALAAAAAGAVGGCSSTAKETSTNTTDAGGTTDSSTTDSATPEQDSATDASDATACLAANGDAGADAGDPLSDCAFLPTFCGPACEGIALNVTPVVGNALVTCMQGKKSAPACGVSTMEALTVVSECVGPILDQLCPDPTVTTFCQPLVTACNMVDAGAPDAGGRTFTQANCEKYATALNDNGRLGFSNCVNAAQDREACAACFDGWQ